MALLETTIEIEQGATYTNGWYFFNPDPLGSGDLSLSVPLNLSGKTMRMMVRASRDPSSALLLSLLDSGLNPGLVLATGTASGLPLIGTIANPNGFTVSITATQSLALTATTSAYFDLFVDNGTQHDLYLQGPFIVGVTVTR